MQVANTTKAKSEEAAPPVETNALCDVVDPLVHAALASLLRARVDAIIATSLEKVGRIAGPIVVYPPTPKEGALLLDFALRVGRIERSACLDIIKRHVAADVAEKVSRELLYERGPLETQMAFTVKYEADTKIALAR